MRSLFNVRLAEVRMTKKEVEERTGISHSSLYNYSTDDGIKRAKLGQLAKVAETIGCSVKDLFEE